LPNHAGARELEEQNGFVCQQRQNLARWTRAVCRSQLVGQHLMPKSHHPLADLRTEQEVAAYVDNVQKVVAKCVDAMPKQAAYIAAHCAANKA
jgi:tryptophan halogenase